MILHLELLTDDKDARPHWQPFIDATWGLPYLATLQSQREAPAAAEREAGAGECPFPADYRSSVARLCQPCRVLPNG